jgi:hypothetical protein
MLGIVAWHNPLVAQDTITLDLSAAVESGAILFDPEKGYWTESFSDAPLVFGPFTFFHSGSTEYGGYWSGFVVGNNGDTDDYGSLNSAVGDWISNQWGNMAGGGIQTDSKGGVRKDEDGKALTEKGIPYLLAFSSGGEAVVTLDGEYEALGVYLNNHPWPYYDNLHGGAFTRALNQEGDYFKVTVTGRNTVGEATGTAVEYLLAEYKDGALHQSTDWEWVDLSPLGKVGSLVFTLTSTDEGAWGMNTAAYFCLDKLQIRTTGAEGIIAPPAATVQIYPNPVADRLTVTGSAIRQVAVVDISGRLVYQFQANGQPQLTIPVSQWGKGAYIVRVTDATGTVFRKIVKK